MEKEYVEKLVETEQRSKSNTKRIDEMEQEVKDNRDLIVSVKEIATEVKYLRENQADMNNRLKKIEEKPFKDYEETKKEMMKKVISFILGIILMFIAFKLGLDKYV